MITRICKINDSVGILIGAASLKKAGLRIGDQVALNVRKNSVITLTPIRPKPSNGKISRVIKSAMKDYSWTMKKLS